MISSPAKTCYSVLIIFLICRLSVNVCESFSPPPSATTSTTTTRIAVPAAPSASTTTTVPFDTQNRSITERALLKLGSLRKKIAAQHQYQLQSTVTVMVGETTTLMPTTQTTSTSTSTSTTLLLDRPPQLTVVSPPTPTPTPMKRSTIPKPSKRRKILIEESISSLSELKYFLEDDERPVVIKFYAKWCKKCQRLGRHFDRLAMDMGDCIVDQQMIDGDVRFAAIEFTPASQEFLTNELQIQGLPTVQLYVGTRKLFDESGASGMKKISQELEHIEEMSHDELLERAEAADDGVLSGLLEESFYDSPDFLNEEW